MTKSDDIEKQSILKDEYLHIQSAIESYDGQIVSIKIWSIIFNLTALISAFATETPEAFLIASLSAAMFWLTEGHWKTFQHAYYDRAGKLEEFFAGKQQDIQPLQTGASWYENWQQGGTKQLLRIMVQPQVYLPHVVTIVSGVVLYVLFATGHMTV